MRIFNKLAISLSAFIIIPTIFLGYMAYYNSKNLIEKEIFSKLNIVADEELSEIETFFSGLRSDLTILAESDIGKTIFSKMCQFSGNRLSPEYKDSGKEADKRFDVFARSYECTHIMLVDAEGRIVYCYKKEHEAEIGAVIPDKDDVFKKVITGIYFGHVYKTTDKEHPYGLRMASPIYDDTGRIAGLVYATLDIGMVHKFVQDTDHLGESWEIVLAEKTPNNKLKFITPLKYESESILTKIINMGDGEALAAQKALLGEGGSGMAVDYRGEEIISAWRPISSLGWGLVVKMDSKEAFSPIKKLYDLLMIIILVTIFSGGLAAFAIARSISEPIKELRSGIKIISGGDLDHRIFTDSKDEIGQLSQEFNQMTEDLKKITTSMDVLNMETAGRRKAEMAQETSQRLLDTAINSISDVFYVCTRSGKYILWNKAFEKITGYSHEEVSRIQMAELFDSEAMPNIAEAVETAFEKGAATVEENIITKDGRRIPMILSGAIIKDPSGRELLCGIGKDISERKKADAEKREQLRELEIFYKASIDREKRIIELKEEKEKLKKQLEGKI